MNIFVFKQITGRGLTGIIQRNKPKMPEYQRKSKIQIKLNDWIWKQSCERWAAPIKLDIFGACFSDCSCPFFS